RFFFSSRRRHTRSTRDWSSDVCSSDLVTVEIVMYVVGLVLYVGATRTGDRAGKLAFWAFVVVTLLLYAGAGTPPPSVTALAWLRSEERRVGKECRCGWVWGA